MNSYNQVFKQRIDKASLAMSHLIKCGCAITSLQINNNGTVIEILPPPNTKVRGNEVVITGTTTGREYLMATRIHGCNVRWKSETNMEQIA